MKRFMERLQENFIKYRERPAVVVGEDVLTYGGLDEESGKIYAYLKAQGLGREDMIFIQVPRDIHFASCMIGVWKAGAAFVMADEGYPEERVEYIYQDTNCKLMLDQNLFDEIMDSCDALPGHEETGLHDAAYAVYTSGSTGNPKGVLHEYGNLDQCHSHRPENDEYDPHRFGFVPPFGFVANETILISRLATAETLYPISPQTLRNFTELKAFIEKHELNGIYLPPSYLRIYEEPASSLVRIYTGSEPANGLYYDGGTPEICNTYTMSEAGFVVLQCFLDSAYDVAPVGQPALDLDLRLIDDEGKTIEGSGQGELCFRNEYVRGYINLPEQTKKAFVDGWYHTADICRRDERGRYYVVGRADDMIKINGNRIEPAEIEAAVKQVTGLKAAAAKGFSEGGRSYVALYYLRKDAKALGILQGEDLLIDRDALEKRLPAYMLPTYYVPLDAFPMNANGKLARKELKAPLVERNMDDYVAPENETEEYLCGLMGKVLKYEPFGAEDDFFLAGGDSIRAIRLVESCEKFDLASQDIYTYRTPRKLAAYLLSKEEEALTEQDEETARAQAFPLLDGQMQNIYYQAYAPDSNFLNLSYMIRLKEEVDPGRFAKAVNETLRAHPALATRISKAADGTYMQQYEERYVHPVEVQTIGEADVDAAMRELNRMFDVENEPLYRCGIFKTEQAAYFGFVIHHLIADGTSFGLILRDIENRYMTEDADAPGDYYFAILAQMEEKKHGESYLEAQRYFRGLAEEKLRDSSLPAGLRPDAETEDKAADFLYLRDVFEKKEGRDGNFFLTACALAQAWYNEVPWAIVTSVYGRRDNKSKMAAAGYLLSILTVCIDVAPGMTGQELLRSVEEQIAYGIAHTEYSLPEDMVGDMSDMVRFNYQKDTLVDASNNPLAAGKLETETDNVMPGSISVNLIDNEGEEKLHFAIRYAKHAYRKERIEAFAKLFMKAVQFLEEDGTR